MSPVPGLPPASVGSPLYLTPEQLAAQLQVSVKTVHRWRAADATMPVLVVGSVVRFPAARLERWLRARESGPGRARPSGSKVRPAPEVPENTGGSGGAPGLLCQVVGQEQAK